MSVSFQIEERLAGFVLTSAKEGEQVPISFRELRGPNDTLLGNRLEGLTSCLFSKIPGFPQPAKVGNLVVVINNDLTCTAYLDEFSIVSKAIVNRSVQKGEPVFLKDIASVESVELGIEIPNTSAVIVVRSFGWKRALFFDFGPLHADSGPRNYSLERAFAQQETLLHGLPASPGDIQAGQGRLQRMKDELDQLDDLIKSRCEDEAKYQSLLRMAPWMLGASYSALLRHQKMDDDNIPDFTALRAYDGCHDIVELKQPFLQLFRTNGSFAANFSDAWHQSERYLDFCQRQRTYLLDQKQLKFENPRCILLLGFDLSSEQRNAIRSKESMSRLITVMTYDQLRRNAQHVFDLVATAEDQTYPGDNGDSNVKVS